MDRRTFVSQVSLAGTVTLQAALQGLASNLKEQGEFMPAFFIGHGSPFNAIEDNLFTCGWKEALKDVPSPKAIVCVSAHWLTRGSYLTAMEKPRTIHDYVIRSRELNAVNYPAQGDPALAKEISQAIRMTSVGLDNTSWGLDHGTWPILRHVFPKAEVPVLQLSIDQRQAGDWHYKLGRQLLALRGRGVLVIGSGNIVHNLRKVDFRLTDKGFDWAIEADEIVKQKIAATDHAALCNYTKLGQAVSLAVPTPDHYLPLLYVLGMQTQKDKAAFFNEMAMAGSLTMTSVKLSPST